MDKQRKKSKRESIKFQIQRVVKGGVTNKKNNEDVRYENTGQRKEVWRVKNKSKVRHNDSWMTKNTKGDSCKGGSMLREYGEVE